MTKNRPLIHICFGLYLILALLSLVWPGMAWIGSRLEPRILGLPPGVMWVAFWVVATCLVLFVYHRATGGEELE